MQKVATVTGAARGIGSATVKRFLVDGWRVALLDIAALLIYIGLAFPRRAFCHPPSRHRHKKGIT
jgi:NAD(P)-dependent dehydrogenase (short-subunit alcohol dehydrogenase family)